MSRTTWTVVVPVKRLALAKTRLSAVAGAARPDLALAFALDTVAAALATPAVGRVVVVTDEPAARAAATALGAVVVADRPDAGLNPALRHGAASARAGDAVAAVSADLPALSPEALGRALALADAHESAYVPDDHGVGTTLYAARTVEGFAPSYGEGSAARHAAAGAVALDGTGLDALRRDVDTPADLRRAEELGVGPRTAAVLARLGPSRGAADRTSCG